MTDLTAVDCVRASVWDDEPIYTFRVTMPQVISRHVLRHRLFSQADESTDASFNFASNRAIPVKKTTDAPIWEPEWWRLNDRGMVPKAAADPEVAERAWEIHREAAAMMRDISRELEELGIHKEQANRYLEPFQWVTCIITTTQPGLVNFIKLRTGPKAQYEVQKVAHLMEIAVNNARLIERPLHIPFDGGQENIESAMIVSAATCARISFDRDLDVFSFEDQRKLVKRLLIEGDASPFEQVAMAGTSTFFEQVVGTSLHKGNFSPPWQQLRHHWRKFLPELAKEIPE